MHVLNKQIFESNQFCETCCLSFLCRLNVSCISNHRVFFPIPGIIRRGDIPNSRIPQAIDVVLSVSEDANLSAPRQQQRDDWDILKAIVY